MATLADLPARLRAYLVAVILTGLALPPIVALLAGGDAPRWGIAALLLVMGALAERFTFHLTHKTAVSVVSAVYLAAVLVLPPAWPGLLALAAGTIGHACRRRSDPVELLFNAAQRGLSTLAAAAAFALLVDLPHLGPDIAGLGPLLAVAAAAAAAYASGGALVAVAAGLQLDTDPIRVFLVTARSDLLAETAMDLVGLQTTYLLRHEPVLALLVALPLAMVHLAIGQGVRLREDTRQALADLVEVVELRDPYTAGHSRRVAAMARELALRLGLTHQEADVIESAGRVHDLGKVAVDPAILMKPGRLTDDELAEMQRHPELGADVVKRIAAYGEGWRLVRHHHERWDGQGYPDRVGGMAVPLGARILAVADTYDALTSARPYREAKSAEFAARVLADGAGTQWDPAVVQALLELLGTAPPREQPAPSAGLAASAAD